MTSNLLLFIGLKIFPIALLLVVDVHWVNLLTTYGANQFVWQIISVINFIPMKFIPEEEIDNRPFSCNQQKKNCKIHRIV